MLMMNWYLKAKNVGNRLLQLASYNYFAYFERFYIYIFRSFTIIINVPFSN